MRSSIGSSAIQRHFVLAIPVLAATWLVTVPALLTTSSFLGIAGVLMALGWVVKTTYLNAQPASSLAQSLHDAEHAGSSGHTRESR